MTPHPSNRGKKAKGSKITYKLVNNFTNGDYQKEYNTHRIKVTPHPSDSEKKKLNSSSTRSFLPQVKPTLDLMDDSTAARAYTLLAVGEPAVD